MHFTLEYWPGGYACGVFKCNCSPWHCQSEETQQRVCHLVLGIGLVYGNSKEERDNQACYQHSVQKPAFLMVWEYICAFGTVNVHIWKDTINAEWYIQVLEQHMLPSKQWLFQGSPCIFEQNNANPQTASVATIWLHNGKNSFSHVAAIKFNVSKLFLMK